MNRKRLEEIRDIIIYDGNCDDLGVDEVLGLIDYILILNERGRILRNSLEIVKNYPNTDKCDLEDLYSSIEEWDNVSLILK